MQDAIRGYYFDGITSRQIEASLFIHEDLLTIINSENQKLNQALIHEVKISSRLANIPISFVFPNGARFETTAFDQLSKLNIHSNVIHSIESKWQIAFIMVFFLLILLIYSQQVLIPKFAKYAAPKIPAAILEKMSEGVEKILSLDQVKTPLLDIDEQKKLDQALQDLKVVNAENKIPVKVIEMKMPNAFILPNGQIFLTSELVRLSSDSDEILSVLLHEVGHHQYHHVIQNLIESSFVSALLFFITGGADWTNLPLVLLTTTYSREYETQADDFSVQTLLKMKKNPKVLSNIFERMQSHDKVAPHLPSFLSTHPSFQERIQRIEEKVIK